MQYRQYRNGPLLKFLFEQWRQVIKNLEGTLKHDRVLLTEHPVSQFLPLYMLLEKSPSVVGVLLFDI